MEVRLPGVRVRRLPARRPAVSNAKSRFEMGTHQARERATALARLAAHHVDLVLLDPALANGGADALLRRRAADPMLRAVPVLVIAPAADADAVARCLALGADDWLGDSLHPALLGARVAASLEGRRLREATA